METFGQGTRVDGALDLSDSSDESQSNDLAEKIENSNFRFRKLSIGSQLDGGNDSDSESEDVNKLTIVSEDEGSQSSSSSVTSRRTRQSSKSQQQEKQTPRVPSKRKAANTSKKSQETAMEIEKSPETEPVAEPIFKSPLISPPPMAGSSKPLKKRLLKASSSFISDIMVSQQNMLHHDSTNKDGNSQNCQNYAGEFVALAMTGDPKNDYEQPGAHENVNFRQWVIKPKTMKADKPPLNMIIRGNYFIVLFR